MYICVCIYISLKAYNSQCVASNKNYEVYKVHENITHIREKKLNQSNETDLLTKVTVFIDRNIHISFFSFF